MLSDFKMLCIFLILIIIFYCINNIENSKEYKYDFVQYGGDDRQLNFEMGINEETERLNNFKQEYMTTHDINNASTLDSKFYNKYLVELESYIYKTLPDSRVRDNWYKGYLDGVKKVQKTEVDNINKIIEDTPQRMAKLKQEMEEAGRFQREQENMKHQKEIEAEAVRIKNTDFDDLIDKQDKTDYFLNGTKIKLTHDILRDNPTGITYAVNGTEMKLDAKSLRNNPYRTSTDSYTTDVSGFCDMFKYELNFPMISSYCSMAKSGITLFNSTIENVDNINNKLIELVKTKIF